MTNKKDNTKTELLKNARLSRGKKTISCREAFRLAGKLKISTARIGQMCNKEKIKVIGCQLGCF